MRQGLSFRSKLTLAFLLVSLLLVGGALGAAQYAATLAAREKIEGDFSRTANELGRLVSARLQGFEGIAAATVNDPLFRSQIAKTNQRDADLGLGDNGLDPA